MPTNRTRRTRAPSAEFISAEAIRAWKAGDYHALCRAVGTSPHQPSPWPLQLTALGCSQGPPPAHCGEFWRAGWPRAQALQRALYEAAGEPGLFDRHGRPLGVAGDGANPVH
jgi:hypothetical protein